MFDVYLLPVSDSHGCYISHVTAKDFDSAEEKFVQELIETYEIEDNVFTLDDICEYANKHDLTLQIGDIYDLDEF